MSNPTSLNKDFLKINVCNFSPEGIETYPSKIPNDLPKKMTIENLDQTSCQIMKQLIKTNPKKPLSYHIYFFSYPENQNVFASTQTILRGKKCEIFIPLNELYNYAPFSNPPAIVRDHEELAYSIAHEKTHCDRGDKRKIEKYIKSPSAFAEGLRESRAIEKLTDIESAQQLLRAGFSLEGAIRYYLRLAEEERKHPPLSDFTHPPSDIRAAIFIEARNRKRNSK